MAFTEEELKAILGMSDIGGMEQSAADQMALANRLRTAYGGVKGTDVGSNIARAAGGISGALSEYQSLKAGGEGGKISGAKQSLLSNLLRARELQAAQQGPKMTPYRGGLLTPEEEEIGRMGGYGP